MTSSDNIELQAAQWLVRRDGDDREQNAAFTAWLTADPRHRAEYLRLATAWGRTGHLQRLRPVDAHIDSDILLRRRPRQGRLGGSRPFAFAAGIALAALGIVLVSRVSQERNELAYRTEVGGLSRVVLADGSTVTLNTETEIRVRLLAKRREITLVRGEAQFTVVHDASRPFEVWAHGHVVRDVGTAFDVRLDSEQGMWVLVTEGQVALSGAPSNPWFTTTNPSVTMVSAGESAVVSGKSVTVSHVGASESTRPLAWQVDELSFEGETLGEAVAEFNRYNERKLRIEDPEIAGLQIGGNFQALDVDSFVAALQRSFSLTIKKSSKKSSNDSLIIERSDAARL